MAEPEKSTEDMRWRHLETSAKIDVAMVVLTLATLVLPHDGSDVLAVLAAWLFLRAHLPWTWA